LFIISGLAGALFSSLHGYATIKLKANHIISGVAMNILAPAITLAVLFVFGEANKMSYSVAELSLGNNARKELTGIISLSSLVLISVIIIS
jgi:simple sugar transport system permease protein